MSPSTERISALNPLLPPAPPPPPEPEHVEGSPVLGDEVQATTGPQTPLYISNPHGPQLPWFRVAEEPLVWVVGVHGGSGASTVAALLGDDAVEMYRHLPVVPHGWAPPRVLLTARTHAAGLHFAAGAASQWATGAPAIDLLGLVVLDDGPRLPKELVAEITRVAAMVPALWHLPWDENWRTSIEPPLDRLSRRTRKSLAQIWRSAEENRQKQAPARQAPEAARNALRINQPAVN